MTLEDNVVYTKGEAATKAAQEKAVVNPPPPESRFTLASFDLALGTAKTAAKRAGVDLSSVAIMILDDGITAVFYGPRRSDGKDMHIPFSIKVAE